jgi:sensor histidine kinase YesM
MDVGGEKDRLIRKGWRGWLTLYAIWTVPILMLASGYYFVLSGTKNAMGWWTILFEYSCFFYFLASLCPPIYRLTGRIRFTPSNWRQTTLVHVLVTILVLIGLQVLTGIEMAVTNWTRASVLDSIINQLTNSRSIYRSILYLVYYLVVVGAMIMIRWNRQRKAQEARTRELEMKASRLESQLTNARLQTLKMQLRPHFFFNALNTISALVEDKQNELAFKTIAQLGDLLRSSLKLPTATTIPLQQELEFIDKYLAIERIRFSDRLKTGFDVPDDCLDLMVPALILQPLVENCIHHAAAAQSAPLLVRVRARQDKQSLVLEVGDDGPGLPANWSMDSHAGVGLENICQRLQVMYGDDSGLILTANTPKGVCARVSIPLSVSVTVPPEAFKNGEDRNTVVLPKNSGASPQEHEHSNPHADR